MAIYFSLIFMLVFSAFSIAASATQKTVLLPLTHALSNSPSSQTLIHLIKSSTVRTAARFSSRRLPNRRQVLLTLSAGSDYTLSFSIGSSSPVSLYMDTGSDLVWFPCSPFECILCDGKPGFPLSSPPPPPPTSSYPIPCSSALCSAAHSSMPTADLCAAALCPLDSIETSSCSPSSFPCPQFYYAYGDGSLVARLRSGPLALPPLSLSNFTFACAHSSFAEPIGVAGFGRGLLSLPAQLSKLSPFLASRFSYCLESHSFIHQRLLRPSPLILGRSSSSPFSYTPLLLNPKHSYLYSVALLSISVGHAVIPATPILASIDRNGNGGMVIDSGTTFTMLPADTYRRLSAEFNRQMTRIGFVRTAAAEQRTGLGPCYGYMPLVSKTPMIPMLGLHYAGNTTVWLPTRNFFLEFKNEGVRVGCLAVMSTGDEAAAEDYGGPAGTLGNFQQQGMEVVYDLEMGLVGFARRRCGDLWDSLSRG